MDQTEPKQEVIWQNPIVAKKAQSGTYFVYVNGEYVTLQDSRESVIAWLAYNWPVGTKITWMIAPW